MEYINRINTGSIPKQVLHYWPRGQRSIRCPVKRWEENTKPKEAIWSDTGQ
jgi:hypothetical protein